MKRAIFILAMCILPALANSKEVLFECGQTSETPFNGWKIKPFTVFDWVDFTDNRVTLYTESGGDYSVEFERKIDEMVGFSTVFLQLGLDISAQSVINYTNVFLSMDGKSWDPIPENVRNQEVQITNGRMNYLYVKIVANVTFYAAGNLVFENFKVSGEYENSVESDTEPLEIEPAIDQKDESFYIFSHHKNVNIETQSEGEYNVYITNLSGQIVFQSKANGSKRIETDLSDGIYIVSIVQGNRIVESKKVVL